MSKIKKILLGILLAVLTLTVIANSILLIIMLQNLPRETILNSPYENSFLKIDDVQYICYDLVYPNTEKVENGTLKVYSETEITDALDKAIEKRDQNNAPTT